MRTAVYNPRLARLMARHSALRGGGQRPFRQAAYRGLALLLDPDEQLLAYADRLRAEDGGSLDVLLLTNDRLIRAFIFSPAGRHARALPGAADLRWVHSRREFMTEVRVDVSLPYHVVHSTALPECHHAEVRIALPPALRRSECEEWWDWDPPQNCDQPPEFIRRPGEGRAAQWKLGSAEFNRALGSRRRRRVRLAG